MNVPSTNARLILLGMAIALGAPRLSRSQDASSAYGSTAHYFPGASEAREEWLKARTTEPDGAPQAGLPSNPLDAIGDIAESMSVIGSGPGVRVKLIPSIREAAEAVRDADDEAEAHRRLTEFLKKYFDADLDRREKEVSQMEQRLPQLREHIDRRRNHKEEIVELQAKVALNDAEGLGFLYGRVGKCPRRSAYNGF